jgi:hypothetical protein
MPERQDGIASFFDTLGHESARSAGRRADGFGLSTLCRLTDRFITAIVLRFFTLRQRTSC